MRPRMQVYHVAAKADNGAFLVRANGFYDLRDANGRLVGKLWPRTGRAAGCVAMFNQHGLPESVRAACHGRPLSDLVDLTGMVVDPAALVHWVRLESQESAWDDGSLVIECDTLELVRDPERMETTVFWEWRR